MEEKGIYFAHSTILFFSCRWALIWLLEEKKKKIRLFQPALYIACVGLDVLEAALEDYSV